MTTTTSILYSAQTRRNKNEKNTDLLTLLGIIVLCKISKNIHKLTVHFVVQWRYADVLDDEVAAAGKLLLLRLAAASLLHHSLGGLHCHPLAPLWRLFCEIKIETFFVEDSDQR